MCTQEVGRAEVDGIKSHMRRSCHQRAFYSSGVACAHIESLPTHSAVEVIGRPYRSSRYLPYAYVIPAAREEAQSRYRGDAESGCMLLPGLRDRSSADHAADTRHVAS